MGDGATSTYSVYDETKGYGQAANVACFRSGRKPSDNAASKAMDIPRSRLNDIVLERRGITPETALRLGRLFGNGAAFGVNLQSHYDLAEAGKTLN